MVRVPVLSASLAFVVLVGTAAFSQPAEGEKEKGIRGRVVVAPELLAAAEWPVDAARGEALKTPANVRRPQGRRLQPLMEPLPELLVLVEGEDVRPSNAGPKTIVIEGMRFVPGQMLLPRGGPVAIENKQGQPITVVDGAGKELATLTPGETKQVTMLEGVHELRMRELPYAKASLKVLSRGRSLPVTIEGDIPLVELIGGEYELSFWLGVSELHRRPFRVAQNGLVYIDATVSANTVVDVTIKDASYQVPIPVAPQAVPKPRPTPVPSPEPEETP